MSSMYDELAGRGITEMDAGADISGWYLSTSSLTILTNTRVNSKPHSMTYVLLSCCVSCVLRRSRQIRQSCRFRFFRFVSRSLSRFQFFNCFRYILISEPHHGYVVYRNSIVIAMITVKHYKHFIHFNSQHRVLVVYFFVRFFIALPSFKLATPSLVSFGFHFIV